MLTLPIKKKWFDMILSGEKKEEYREIKPYYEKRFNNILRNNPRAFDSKGTLNEWLITDIKYILPVRFRNGYSLESPSFIANCRLTIGTGRQEWGAELGKRYYILTIQDIIKER